MLVTAQDTELPKVADLLNKFAIPCVHNGNNTKGPWGLATSYSKSAKRPSMYVVLFHFMLNSAFSCLSSSCQSRAPNTRAEIITVTNDLRYDRVWCRSFREIQVTNTSNSEASWSVQRRKARSILLQHSSLYGTCESRNYNEFEL